MKSRFTEKVILIIGANGGLGSAFARAFAAEGARLILVGRNLEALSEIAAVFLEQAKVYSIDFTSAESHAGLRQFIAEQFGSVDVIVNAVGKDVRKPLEHHSVDEIQMSLDANLRGAILLTQTFLPMLREKNDGMIVHVGGFADGKLAFPFYSVDAATRAGLFTFIESVNRELSLDNSKAMVGYFSPSPADTEAERPFHPIWQEMGVKILPVEKIAAELLTMVTKRRKVRIMGGFSTRLFAGVNAISPALADSILLRKYSRTLKKHLIEKNPSLLPASTWTLWLGVGLVVLSTLLYGGLIVLPFLSISTASKLAATPMLILFGEATFWVGGALLGKEVVARYKKYLNPCNWFSKPASG